MEQEEKEKSQIELLIPEWVNSHCGHLEVYTIFGRTYKNDRKSICCCSSCKFRYKCVRGCISCAIEFRRDRARPLKEEECKGFENILKFLERKEILKNPIVLCNILYPHKG